MEDRNAAWLWMDVIPGLFGLVVLTFLLWKWLGRPDYSQLPKSPPRIPLLGNLYLLMQGKPFNKLADEVAAQVGDVFTLWFGGEPTVFIGEHNMVKELFVNNAQIASDRFSHSTLISVASLGYKGILFRSRDKQQQISRKIGSTALRDLFSNKNNSCALMLDSECKRLLKNIAQASENNQAVNPAEFMYETTIRVISGTCFGKSFVEQPGNVAKVRKLADLAFKYLSYGPFFLVHTIPLLRFIPFFKLNSVCLFAKARDELINEELKRHREHMDDTPHDVTDVLLMSSHCGFDEEERVMVISDLIIAGSETVSTTLCWAILCLVRYPEWQTKVRNEINAIASSTEDLHSISMKSVPLLRAFYHEVQRWSSSVATSVVHVTSKDVSIGKYKIPSGTSVLAAVHLMHNNPDYWENPRKFDPMRFINEEGEFAIPNKSFMPFSVGPRSCPGDSLAKREMFFVLLYLIYHVTFLPEEEGKMPSTEAYEEATVRPLPFKVRLRIERALAM